VIQTDIATATASVAGGRVYQDGEVPENVSYPLVVFRGSHNPIMVLGGYSGLTISEYVFECWGEDTATQSAKAVALATAAELTTAIEAAQTTVLPSQWRLPSAGEDYDLATLDQMEPVRFGFSHS